MERSEELSLWLTERWLVASDYPVQAMVVEDLQVQTQEGVPLSEALSALSTNTQRAGDFGMEIAGTLLAPVLIEILKSFWSSYLKKLGEDAGAAAAELTVDSAKHWFQHKVANDSTSQPSKELSESIDSLVAAGKLSSEDAARLKSQLNGNRLA